ncbi:MAG: guanine-specific ribonuclease N1 and T1 [Actinobacteria bacterium]|nr:guanine-specific ribonuclease N1 and T1 [Actinomycetota bacterium]
MPQVRRPLLVLMLLGALLGGGYAAQGLRSPATGPAPAPSSVPAPSVPAASVAALSTLPPQVADTYRLVRRGGPFPYARDGVVFANREALLPDRSGGYYREYTVPTPGTPDRGARRLIVGAGGEVYYTADRYLSFRLVDVRR